MKKDESSASPPLANIASRHQGHGWDLDGTQTGGWFGSGTAGRFQSSETTPVQGYNSIRTPFCGPVADKQYFEVPDTAETSAPLLLLFIRQFSLVIESQVHC